MTKYCKGKALLGKLAHVLNTPYRGVKLGFILDEWTKDKNSSAQIAR